MDSCLISSVSHSLSLLERRGADVDIVFVVDRLVMGLISRTSPGRLGWMDSMDSSHLSHLSLSLFERRGVLLLQALLVDGLGNLRHILHVPASKSNTTLVWVSKREDSLRETHLASARTQRCLGGSTVWMGSGASISHISRGRGPWAAWVGVGRWAVVGHG
jgi:hypothetical protein